MKKIIILTTILLVVLTIICFSHSGRTDANGGHYNRSTGEYHYHHGMAAHDHPNGICPYSTSSSNNNNTLTTSSATNNTSVENYANKYSTAKNMNIIFIIIIAIESIIITRLLLKNK